MLYSLDAESVAKTNAYGISNVIKFGTFDDEINAGISIKRATNMCIGVNKIIIKM
jgi:hypothetical protein